MITAGCRDPFNFCLVGPDADRFKEYSPTRTMPFREPTVQELSDSAIFLQAVDDLVGGGGRAGCNDQLDSRRALTGIKLSKNDLLSSLRHSVKFCLERGNVLVSNENYC